MVYFAHTDGTSDKRNWQKLSDHLNGVADLAERFANKFGAGQLVRLAGLLHDIGKYSSEFQLRLQGLPIRVDHSTVGAQAAFSRYNKPLGYLLAYIIAGHHSGIPNGGSVAEDASLECRLQRAGLPDAGAWRSEISFQTDKNSIRPRLTPINKHIGITISFYIRMLYSCLVDADFLDTERYADILRFKQRGEWPAPQVLQQRLYTYLDQKHAQAPANRINNLRGEILAQCHETATALTGLFTLTVPTGGGKTLSSLAFAIDHLICNDLDRIIYVIPYTSIIEQNANVFRNAIGPEAVLEHHSNFQPDSSKDEDAIELVSKIKLSAENWDVPLVVTTNVQFFESLFANRSSKCRKLHNITRSVIILDEAQMMPLEYLKPCLAALTELVVNYGSSVVLCTATQPALNRLLPPSLPITEISKNVDKLYTAFRRVEVSFIGDKTDAQLVDELSRQRQVLCIVNTRRHANTLYQQLRESNDIYHLSARMCPMHRTKKLEEIRQLLKDGAPCRLISTQLIEAGVDIDFPVVYRSIAGIDSIAQAAGRCNREGRSALGDTRVFVPEKHGLPGGWFSRCAEIAKMVLREFTDPLSLAAVHRYFEYLYCLDDEELDKKHILDLLQENERTLRFPFEQISDEFKLIDSSMVSVIIPWDDNSKELIRELQFANYTVGIARCLQPYTVQIYRYEFGELLRQRAIRTIAGSFHILENNEFYNDETGLTMDQAVSISEVLIF